MVGHNQPHDSQRSEDCAYGQESPIAQSGKPGFHIIYTEQQREAGKYKQVSRYK